MSRIRISAVKRFATIVGALLVAGFAQTLHAAPELVSSDIDGLPLMEGDTLNSVYRLEDITRDGRYVLFTSNTSCNIYRKDRLSGELLTVFENTLTSDETGYSWCNGAGMSADGNLVAASPSQNLAEPVISCIPEDCAAPWSETVYSYGDVIEVVQKNLTTQAITEVTREYIVRSAEDISRIELGGGCCYGASFQELSADGQTALVAGFSTFGFGTPLLGRAFRVVRIDAQTISDVRLPLDANLDTQPFIAQAKMDGAGEQLLLQVTTFVPQPLPDPRLPVQQPTGPGSVIICGQIGRCDITPLPPGPCDPVGGDSWWCFGGIPPQLDQLIIYEIDSRLTQTIFTRDIDSPTVMGPLALAGNGKIAYTVLSGLPSVCVVDDSSGQTICPAADAEETGPTGLLQIDMSSATAVVKQIPSICDDTDVRSATQCMLLDTDDVGQRVLIGVGSGIARIVDGPATGPSDEGSAALCDFFNDPSYCERDARLNLPSDIGPNPGVPTGSFGFDWYITDTATNHNERVSITDGYLFEAPIALLSGDGSQWAFTSAYGFGSFTGTSELLDGAVYADSAGKSIDLAVVTRRAWRQPRAGDVKMRSIISNYGDTAANLVTVEFMVRRWTRDKQPDAPALTLNYDNCRVYDDTLAGNKTLLLTDGGELLQKDDYYVLRCAIGLLEAGQRFTLEWQLADEHPAPKFIRTYIEANEADPREYNNRSWKVIAGRRWAR